MRNPGLLMLVGILALATVVVSAMMLANVSDERDAFWTALWRGPLTPKRCLTERGLMLKRFSTLLGGRCSWRSSFGRC